MSAHEWFFLLVACSYFGAGYASARGHDWAFLLVSLVWTGASQLAQWLKP
jgi:hypothetical protein